MAIDTIYIDFSKAFDTVPHRRLVRSTTLALVYTPAEYCAPVLCRSTHSRLVDVGLNASLRTITGYFRPTQVDQLPVLAEIAPPALRWEAATLVLGRRACQHGHLLHDVIETPTHRKSPRPSHSPCSPTSVVCPSTRDGDTLDTSKVG